MIISEQWLREWIDIEIDTTGLVERLTLGGLEVASVSRAGPALSHVVVGHIEGVGAHPRAEQLSICQVDIGRRTRLQIVCGASNARPGLKVATALPDATLPDDLPITARIVHGVESQGMLCSAAELGIEDQSLGILELDSAMRVGRPVAEALAFGDAIIDLEVTPNRGDCLSIMGIARELALLTGVPLKRRDVPAAASEIESQPRIELLAGAACPRYVGRCVQDLDPSATTPFWMAERLRRCGLRPVSAIVDVTNYVMLELGQPMHAFDADRIERGIRVRYAEDGEQLELLDGSTVPLDPQTLVIADHARPIALAGIMGGADSAIDPATTNIIFEAAHFRRQTVAVRARELGKQTDSAYRFERGVDPLMPEVAAHYASYLATSIAGGHAGPSIDRHLKRYLPARHAIRVWHQQVNRLLGVDIPKPELRRIFKRVGSRVTETAGGWRLTPPAHRFDLERECDLVEEVARVRGYDNIPATSVHMRATAKAGSERDVPIIRIKQVLVERGYHEAITYSFVDPTVQRRLASDQSDFALANPLTDKLAVMRNSLWTGLLQAAVGNRNRQHPRIRLFEIGRIFRVHDGGLTEVPMIGGLAYGSIYPVQWGNETRPIDFFDPKSDLEALLALSGCGAAFSFEAASVAGLHPGQAAIVNLGDRTVGRLGRLHPALQSEFEIDGAVFMFELELTAVSRRPLPAYRDVSHFPAIRRDLALLVEADRPVADIVGCVRETAGELLTDLEIFDLYHPPGESASKKSVGIGLTLRHSSRTLKDQDVEAVIEKVLDVLECRIDARLRT